MNITVHPHIAAILLTVAGVLGVSESAEARITAASAFAEAPKSVLPLLDNNTRLDMVDYFNSGMSTASTNNFGGKSRVTDLSDMRLRAEMTDASTYEFDLLPASSGDTLIAVISTVATPAPDSRLSVYSSDYSDNLTSAVCSRPTLDEWLTAQGKSDRSTVEAFVPFLLISYSYDPSTQLLTLTNNTRRFLTDDVYDMVSADLLTALTYRWDGKKFVKQ